MGKVPEPRIVKTPRGVVRVREARLEDAEAFIAHRRGMTQTSEHSVTMLDEVEADAEKIRQRIREYLENPGCLMVVAELAGQTGDVAVDTVEAGGIGGAGILGELSFRCGTRRRVQHHGDFGISVEAGWRGMGLGRAMIQTMLDWATAHQFIEKIYLGVFENNTGARRLYTSMGFRKEAIRRDYFKLDSGEYVNDILMSKWVKPPPGSAV